MEPLTAIKAGTFIVKNRKGIVKSIAGVIVLILAFFFIFTGATPKTEENLQVGSVDLPATVTRWRPQVEIIAKKNEIPEYVDIILAIIMVESGGNGGDIMQSSESAGLAPNALQDPILSLEQGIKYFAGNVKLSKSLECDIWSAVGGYNFGSSYIQYVSRNGKKHETKVAEMYSKNVVAPSLGNVFGTMYNYPNPIAIPYNGGKLYLNGGNFFYVDLIKQYLVTAGSNGAIADFQKIIKEAEKYAGQPYVWGGSNPTTGFDCSGLTQWSYGLAGIKIGRVTTEQWANTVTIDPKDAKAGDLIFFKGTYGAPDYISHVGIYIDEAKMFDSNSSGIGYHTWNEGYWKQHFAGIRRIKN